MFRQDGIAQVSAHGALLTAHTLSEDQPGAGPFPLHFLSTCARAPPAHSLHLTLDRHSVEFASNSSADISSLTSILGRYRNDLFPVEICRVGYRTDGQAKACVPCEAGYFASVGGLRSCSRCLKGHVSAKAASVVSLLVLLTNCVVFGVVATYLHIRVHTHLLLYFEILCSRQYSVKSVCRVNMLAAIPLHV